MLAQLDSSASQLQSYVIICWIQQDCAICHAVALTNVHNGTFLKMQGNLEGTVNNQTAASYFLFRRVRKISKSDY